MTEPRPWLRAVAWLAFLGPFFFLTYNLANFVASQRTNVPSIVFSWERRVPFLAWTIVPYWSSDLLYALSFALCRTRAELDLHGKRLLVIQVFSVLCFIVFPLRFSFAQPSTSGFTGSLFQLLGSFDQPFNQAPSLHVSLAVILWDRYRAHASGLLRWLLGGWFLLVALSAMTTYQHHFIDLPLGAWAGLLTIAAIPANRLSTKLASIYLLAAMLLTACAFWFRGAGWLLVWPGFALTMVAAAYWSGDVRWLGKRSGSLPVWMWPYALGAWINSRLWTRGEVARNHLSEAVWIGRAPLPWERDGVASVVDLTAELPLASDFCIPILDLTVPTEAQLEAAVSAIQLARRPTLICCALGYSRSAAAGAAWLLASGHVATLDEALDLVKRTRPQVVIRPKLVERLQRWAEGRSG